MRIVLNGIAALAIGAAVAVGSTPFQPSEQSGEGAGRTRFAAVAFDYFVLFNPDSIVSAVEPIAPGGGREFANLWRTRQFEYSWLRTIADRYVDFSAITEDALV